MTALSTQFQTRTDRVEAALADLDVDLLYLTSLTNLRYLTGYSGSNGFALIGPARRVFVTDFRYIEQSEREVDPSYERIIASQTLTRALPELVGDKPLRLGFEESHLSVADHRTVSEILGDQVRLVPVGGLVEELRRVKDAGEIELIKRAAEIADSALEEVLAQGLEGRTEREIALRLSFAMQERGADGPAFRSIIATGANGALPHAQPGAARIQRGDLVVIDWGAYLDGYNSDCTRTVAVGEVSAEQREAYDLVLRAQLAGLAAVKPGADSHGVDHVVREIIDGAGHKEHYGHGLGHGVGLEVHESPTLSYRTPAGAQSLQVGEVVTIEPGVYLPGNLGVRIEDLVVVRAEDPEILTGIPKELRIVD